MTTIQNTNAIINGSTTTLDPNKTYIMTENGLVEDKAIDPGKEKWYKVPEAAKELGKSTAVISSAIKRGTLIAKEIPGKSKTGYIYMISETALAEYLEDPSVIRDPEKNQKARNEWVSWKKRRTGNTGKPPVDENGNPMLDINDIHERTGRGFVAIRNAMTKGFLVADKYLCGRAHKWFATEAAVNSWVENLERNERIAAEKKETSVEKKEEVAVKATVHHIPDDINDDLANLQLAIAELMLKAREEAYDEAYKKGFEDGKLSVENDSIVEYRKGYERGKKEAKSELLAVLKVV